MAVTLNHQHSPFPSSGNTLTRDGSPLHTRLGVDLILGCNNLGYTFPHGGAVDGTGVRCDNYALGSPGERFAIQVPTVLPADGYRFCWTLGIRVDNDDILDMYLEAVTLYISSDAYKGENDLGTDAFDPSAMGSPYSSMTEDISETIVAGSSTYYFIDHSAGTTGTWLPFSGPTTGGLVNANLIFTTTGNRADEIGLKVYFQDFRWWIKPE